MKRRLIIEGNAVYEVDEDCLLRKRLDTPDENHKKKEADNKKKEKSQ